MDADGVRRTLRLVSPSSQVERNGQWFQTNCPFAPWTHPKRSDRNPSFGIVASDEGTSIYHCFTCKKKGTIQMLWEDLEDYRGEDYSEYIGEARDAEVFGPKLPRWGDRSPRDRETESARPIANEISLVYDQAVRRGPSLRYLLRRGISQRTARDVRLRYDYDDGHGVPRILFDVRDLHGNLFGFTGRAVDSSVEPRVRDYYGLDKRLFLLGEHFCSTAIGPSATGADAGKPVVLVEGPFDYLKVRQAGYDALAVMHSGLTPQQRRTVIKIGRPVILMYDNDEAGWKGSDSAAESLRRSARVLRAVYPVGASDPGSMRTWDVDLAIRRARMF